MGNNWFKFSVKREVECRYGPGINISFLCKPVNIIWIISYSLWKCGLSKVSYERQKSTHTKPRQLSTGAKQNMVIHSDLFNLPLKITMWPKIVNTMYPTRFLVPFPWKQQPKMMTKIHVDKFMWSDLDHLDHWQRIVVTVRDTLCIYCAITVCTMRETLCT